ncbi:MAG: FtsQ-type POTRA domain-containing protein [Firmicutes bacterium]|nr:FtsQ-type POTRA domain-containing protein [Bacillota bacterium]
MIKLKLSLVFGGLAVLALLVLMSPVFAITKITVAGNEKVTEAELLAACGVKQEDSLFSFNARKAAKNVAKNLSYVESVTFRKVWPNELRITVAERKLSGYVKYMNGSYLYIDENGRVLEVSGMFTEELPVVVGLKFSKFSVGELLDVDNKTSFSTLVVLTRLFDKYGMRDYKVSKVDVSDSGDIHLYVRNIDVKLGSAADADQKIRTLREILGKMPDADNIRGVLDLTVISGKYTFKILT